MCFKGWANLGFEIWEKLIKVPQYVVFKCTYLYNNTLVCVCVRNATEHVQ